MERVVVRGNGASRGGSGQWAFDTPCSTDQPMDCTALARAYYNKPAVISLVSRPLHVTNEAKIVFPIDDELFDVRSIGRSLR